MDGQKIPKKVWWLGAALVLAAAVGKYFLAIKKTKSTVNEKGSNTDKKAEAKKVKAELYHQFNLRPGETARIDAEGLDIKFSGVIGSKFTADGSHNSASIVQVEFELTQELSGITESGKFVLDVTHVASRPSTVETGDKLIGSYKIQLMGFTAPRVTGDIPERNDYVANLVILKV